MKPLIFSIQKRKGTFRLHVQAQWPEGITGVLGHSGAGKSTLLHCLIGLETPEEGEIQFRDQVFFTSQSRINLPAEKRKLGMVFQEALLFPHLSVRENIFYNLDSRHNNPYAVQLIDLLHLSVFLDRKPVSLSVGERQRVALARALIRKPEILFMDEPVSAVDLSTRYEILNYLKEYYQIFKIPMVYVSHSISELLYFVERVFVLKEGQWIAQDVPIDRVLTSNYLDKFPMEEVNNVYDLPVKEIDQKEQLAVLDFSGFPLSVAYPYPEIKPRVRILIRANDILLATHDLEGISARNIIPAEIERIVLCHPRVMLCVKIHGLKCFVEITAAALQDLRLREKQKVFLIIKARSVGVLN